MLNSFQTLTPGSNAPSLHGDCDKPFGLGFNFMEQEVKRVYILEFSNCYDIDEYGEVRSHYYNATNHDGTVIKKRPEPKIIKPRLNTKGKYLYVRIGFNGLGQKIKNKSIHRLVASCFLENYSEDLEVNHNDGNRFNNHYTNLSMMTRKENMRHAWETGLVNVAYGENQSQTKLTESEVLEIFQSKEQTINLALKFNMSRRQIWMIRSGRNWGHLTSKQIKK